MLSSQIGADTDVSLFASKLGAGPIPGLPKLKSDRVVRKLTSRALIKVTPFGRRFMLLRASRS